MSGYSWEAQVGLYNALAAVSPAIAGGRIYSEAPDRDGLDFPYVLIQSGEDSPEDVSSGTGSGGDDGERAVFDLHVYSSVSTGKRGDLVVKSVADQIKSVLHGASLTVAGRASAFCWWLNTRTIAEADGVTRRSIVTVEVVHRN